MNRRERVLIISVGLLATLVLWYFYIYSPKQAEYAKLSQELAGREAERTRLEAVARQITRLEQEYRESQSFIAAVEAKLPGTKEIPSLMVQLERLTTSLGIDFRSIRPGQLIPVKPTSPSQTGGTGTAQPVAGIATYSRLPIKLSIAASFAELLRLTNSVQTFPRLVVIRKFTMGVGTLPDLRSDMDIETYVLPKEAR